MDEEARLVQFSDIVAEPFSSALTEAESYLERGEYAPAQSIYEQLLALAESFQDEPDIRLMRAHLLANIGMLTTQTNLALSEVQHTKALDLLRGLKETPKGPVTTQLWLDISLKTLVGLAEVFHKKGDLTDAAALLDEATALLPEFADGDGTRVAEVQSVRISVLTALGSWGAAEELAVATLATIPPQLSTVPYLRTSLGLIYAETGRLDLAEDTFAQAGEEFLALGMAEEPPHLIAHRGEVAMRRGDQELAKRLYRQAAALFEQAGQAGNLAMCEQALGLLAGLRGENVEAEARMTASLAGLQEAGMAVSAAGSMVFASQHAYLRGDIAETIRLSETARAVFEERGLYEQCARTDYMLAMCIWEGLSRDGYGEHRKEALYQAIWLATPAALALEAARFDFAGGHARNQWLALAEDAMRLVFGLAALNNDPALLFELVEFRCAGAPLAPAASLPEPVAGPVFPDAAMKFHDWTDGADSLGGMAAELAASEGLRVALPPKVLVSQGTDRTALREFIDLAEARYHRKIVSDETVQSW